MQSATKGQLDFSQVIKLAVHRGALDNPGKRL